jgi:hypothetical protein
MDWKIRGSKDGREKIIFSPKRLYALCGQTSLIFNGYRGSLPGIKRPERGFDYSFPHSAEVKNEWSSTFTFFICLLGVDRYSFIFNKVL